MRSVAVSSSRGKFVVLVVGIDVGAAVSDVLVGEVVGGTAVAGMSSLTGACVWQAIKKRMRKVKNGVFGFIHCAPRYRRVVQYSKEAHGEMACYKCVMN
jgi:hypothetical protein